MPTSPSFVTGGNARVVQGFFKGGRPPLTAGAPVAQPFGSGSAFGVPSTVHLAPHGGGQPLPAAVLQRMEEFFGTSFADVRVHVGPQAASIGALAFTMGSDLYFAPGKYDPHSAHGQRLLGHELAHVVQQRAGRVRNPLGGVVAVVQDPALEAEAERMGMRVGTPPAGASPLPRAQAAGRLAPHPSPGPGGAARAYLVLPPVQGPDGRMRIRATLPGSAGEAGSVRIRPTRAGLLEVTDLYVAPAHRRQGLGARLMQVALRTGRNQGVGGVVLEARPSDAGISAPALRAMYERMGFRVVRTSARGTPIMQFGTGAVQPGPSGRHRPVLQRSAAANSGLFGLNQAEANPADQLAFEWGIHNLHPDVMASHHQKVTDALTKIHHDFHNDKNSDRDVYLKKVGEQLEAVAGYLMNQNPVLKEAWDLAVTQTRSSKYADVGSKFGAKLRKVLDHLKQNDTRWAEEIDSIDTEYINKHHLLLKSIYPDKQIVGANLLHVGNGKKGSTNTDLHKVFHEVTSNSTTGSANYSKMAGDITKVLEAFVKSYEDNPYAYAGS